MTGLVFVDTETTGLDHHRHEVWEIGLIYGSTEEVFRPRPNLATADPTSLRMNRFYERTDRNPLESDSWRWEDPADVAARIAPMLAGRHMVAAVPSFDAAFLDRFLRVHGQAPAWHYHLIDVEGMAVGWLLGQGRHPGDLPWKSDELSLACGVDPPGADERHTALGDARWVRRWYDELVGGVK